MRPRAILLVLGAVAAVLVVVLATSGGDERYAANVVLRDAGGLREGANVRLDGAPVGSVEKLELGADDRAHARIRLDPSVAPLGANAKVVIQADGLFGERYVDLDRGDVSRPQPDGSTIPPDRATVSTRLDDVIDTLNPDTRGALKQFFNEQGTLIVGRGRNLGEVLAALPPSLNQTGELLGQLGADQAVLGRLIEESDRVVAEVTRNRGSFGDVLAAAGRTLETLDTRRTQLGQTLDEAPSTLRSTQRVLAALQRAAGPLAPAADGLRRTSPALAQTLRDLPAFAEAALPTFADARRVAPDLARLGAGATPTVVKLATLARALSPYATDGLNPFTALLQTGAPNLFGLMEGWARSTQGYDGVSRIFRFGATTGTDTFAALLPSIKEKAAPKTSKGGSRPAPRPAAPKLPSVPKPKVPALPKLDGRDLVPPVVAKVLEDVGRGKTDEAVTGLVDGVLGGGR